MQIRKILLFFVMICFLISAYPAKVFDNETSNIADDGQIHLPKSFPAGYYTPHGYINNPYHSMVLNRSGVIRSLPPLGFGYWRRNFKGTGVYKGGPCDYINYLSLLQMSVSIDNVNFLELEDFKKNAIKLSSKYHTKHMMSYDWQYKALNFSFKYFLPAENTLACLVEIDNLGKEEKEVLIHATNIYGLWETIWWGSNGLSANYRSEIAASVSKIWAYGDVFVLASDLNTIAYKSTGSKEQWKKWITEKDLLTNERMTVYGPGPIYTMQSYKIFLPPEAKKIGLIYLSRGKNENWAIKELKSARKQALDSLRKQLAEDEKFWSNCPVLEGDWPEFWKHGWVYDWETLRMNVHLPIGIFNHPWDGMQVHSPRVVLAETALDMFALSFADAGLAKEVIYGTFADAIMPNVPCVREDGSVNMIGADGSECGTAPMWGFPFHVIESIFLLSGDKEWVRKLYPYLKAYIEWWLENRTDKDGWLHCNNSWESGQDGSQRFLVEGEGDPAEFVRTVDVEASMAEAMKIMETFAPLADKPEDQPYWKRLAEQRIKNTRSMFVDGWFRDVDARNHKPIIFKNFYPVIMLTPITCNVATEQQAKIIKPMFPHLAKNSRIGPPSILAFTEAAWNADELMAAAQAVADIANRIYERTDKQTVMFEDQPELYKTQSDKSIALDKSYSYRIPGIANEGWPVDFRPAGAENYGWGAILPAHIIRNIIGFRESKSGELPEFYLAPAIPDQFTRIGNTLSLRNLHYRDITFNLTYTIQDIGTIKIMLAYESRKTKGINILNKSGKLIANRNTKKENDRITFLANNGERYLIRFY